MKQTSSKTLVGSGSYPVNAKEPVVGAPETPVAPGLIITDSKGEVVRNTAGIAVRTSGA